MIQYHTNLVGVEPNMRYLIFLPGSGFATQCAAWRASWVCGCGIS